MAKTIPRANRMPNATHNRTMLPSLQDEGGGDVVSSSVGVDIGDASAAAGVERGE
jgi:hypothetical protein